MQADNWDDQYRDYAWEEMKKLLDKEMPIRAIPWWKRYRLLLLLLLLIPISGVAFWWMQQPVKTESKELPKEPTSLETVVATAEVIGGIPEESLPVAEPEPDLEFQPDTQGITFSNEERESNKLSLPQANQEPLNAVQPLSLETTEPIIEGPVRPGELPIRDDRITTTLETVVSPVAMKQPEVPSLAEMPGTKLRQLVFGISGEGRISSFPELSGGFFVEDQIGGSRFSWRLGLQAGVQTSIQTFGFANQANMDDALEAQDTTGIHSDPNTDLHEVSLSSGNVYYLDLRMPIECSYRISPAFSLQAGLNLRYLINASEKPGELLNSVRFTGAAYSESFQNVGDSNPSRTRFGMLASAGASWNWSANWSMYTDFVFGLTDENAFLEGTQRQIGGKLGIRFYFR